MTIRSNIESVMQAIRDGDMDLGETLRSQAVRAIIAGQGSPAWSEYMERFGQTPAQIARLTPTDDTKDVFDMDVARTYLVGNGVCGAATTGFHLIEGVDDKLDEGLDDS